MPDGRPVEEKAFGTEARVAQEEGKERPPPTAEVEEEGEEGEADEKMRIRKPDHAVPAILEVAEKATGTSSRVDSVRGLRTASVETEATLSMLRCTMSKIARQRIVRMPAMVQKPPRSVGSKMTDALRPKGLRTAKRSMDKKASRRRADALGGEDPWPPLRDIIAMRPIKMIMTPVEM